MKTEISNCPELLKEEYGFSNATMQSWLEHELIQNLERIHTTTLGVERIKRNLTLETNDVVEWCKSQIASSDACISRNGKNWYIHVDHCIITVNAYSYTIITAHKEKNF